jgi:hypothetical protein
MSNLSISSTVDENGQNESIIQKQLDETPIPTQSLPALPIQEAPAE